VSGRRFEKEPDWEYYARRVAQTLAYITEVYGWDEKALFTGTQPARQKSLFSDDFGGEKEEPGEPKRTDRKLTLEDFF
jgi:DNA polymerase I